MTDTRKHQRKNRRRQMEENNAAKKRQPTDDDDDESNRDIAEKELRAKLIGGSRDKKILQAVGRPDANSLVLANKLLFSQVHELLSVHKRMNKHIDPDVIDWSEDPKVLAARAEWARLHLLEVRRKAKEVKSLTDGIIRAAKVQAEIDVDAMPDRLILDGVAALDARLGVDERESEAQIH